MKGKKAWKFTKTVSRCVIVGVDPGTTTGMAVMDLEGAFLFLGSGKGFSRARLSRFILEQGKPVIIASDKCPPPSALERLSISFSSMLVFPEEDMSRLKKSRIAGEFRKSEGVKWQNRHERDALVAVLIGWKRIRNLMARIDSRMEKYAKRKDYNEMKVFVKAGALLRSENTDSLIREFMQHK